MRRPPPVGWSLGGSRRIGSPAFVADVRAWRAGRQGMTSMSAEEAPERITGTSKLLEEQGERYEHWKGGREQVDVA